jgi:hypothetical protein
VSDDWKESKSNAAGLVSLAKRTLRLSIDDATGEPFAVLRDGPNVAIDMHELRVQLAGRLHEEMGKIAKSGELTDAMTVVAFLARKQGREGVYLRTAKFDDAVIIDLGDSSGRCISVTKESWEVIESSPVVFRRTAATCEMPEPTRGGSIDELRQVIHSSDDNFKKLIAWTLNAFLPSTPHPVLAIEGLQGAAKTSAARAILTLVDPSTNMIVSPPTSEEKFKIAAAPSWAFTFDNITHIPQWLSDAICRVVTGATYVDRLYYTNKGLSVTSMRRCLIITSITPGMLRGDLAERVFTVELAEMPKADRIEDAKFMALLKRINPSALGALLDILVQVLKVKMTQVRPSELERMADFHLFLIALDTVMGWNTVELYQKDRATLAEKVVEYDRVALAITDFMTTLACETWKGTAAQLLSRLKGSAYASDKEFPKTPSMLSAHLARVEPALRLFGIAVDRNREGKQRDRTICITKSSDLVREEGVESAYDKYTNERNVDHSEILGTEGEQPE